MSSRRYVILTPFKKPEVLAGICQLHSLDVWIVPSREGALVVRDQPVKEYDDWDISELLGEDETTTLDTNETDSTRDEDTEIDSNDGIAVGKELGKLSKAGVVLLQSELGDDVGNETGVSGMITGHIITAREVKDVAAGILVATAPQIVEDLLIGEVKPEDVTGAVHSVDIEPTVLSKLASRGKADKSADDTEDTGTQLPPKKPRRFFGKNK